MDSIYIAIMLYILAIVLALVDLYIPSAGMLLILSFVAAVSSVLFGFKSGTTQGMAMLTLVLASVPILAVVALRVWPNTPVGRRVVLGLPPGQPTTANDQQNALSQWIGHVLISEYPLMPSGQITIERRPYNALAEAGYIDAGQRIEVVAVRYRDLIVRVTDKPLTPARPRPPHELSKESAVEPTVNQSLLDVPAEQLGLDSIED